MIWGVSESSAALADSFVVLWEMFWGIFMGSERLWKVTEGYVVFTDVLGFFWGGCHWFWLVKKGSERSEAFLENQGFSEASWSILVGFEQVGKVPEGSEAFSDVHGCSETLLWVLSSSATFITVLQDYSMFCDILMHSDAISSVLTNPGRFLKNLRHTLMFWEWIEVF